jgi:hypothetical protein
MLENKENLSIFNDNLDSNPPMPYSLMMSSSKIADSDPSSKPADTNPCPVALLMMQLLEALNP